MPKRSGQKPSEYVGYRHPPTATRFKPGQSGNLKGRPRATRSVGTILQEVVNRKIRLRIMERREKSLPSRLRCFA
jgi:hypothetical protein